MSDDARAEAERRGRVYAAGHSGARSMQSEGLLVAGFRDGYLAASRTPVVTDVDALARAMFMAARSVPRPHDWDHLSDASRTHWRNQAEQVTALLRGRS